MLKIAFVASIASILGLGADCGDEAAPATPAAQTPPGATPPGTPPPATTKKANRVTGSIKDERGNVITVPGATFEVRANGLVASGEVQGVKPPVAANGTFDAELVALGNYTVTADIKVTWRGQNYILPLAPVGDNSVGQLSSDGVVQDFIWKLSGPRQGQAAPVNPDPSNFTHWYGAGISLVRSTYRDDLATGVTPPPVGTKLEFVLTPKEPTLIDGSASKELKLERTFTGFSEGNALSDIPLCVYALSGFEIGAGGERTPLVFKRVTDPYTPSVVIDYPPSASGRGDPFYPQYNFDITR